MIARTQRGQKVRRLLGWAVAAGRINSQEMDRLWRTVQHAGESVAAVAALEARIRTMLDQQFRKALAFANSPSLNYFHGPDRPMPDTPERLAARKAELERREQEQEKRELAEADTLLTAAKEAGLITVDQATFLWRTVRDHPGGTAAGVVGLRAFLAAFGDTAAAAGLNSVDPARMTEIATRDGVSMREALAIAGREALVNASGGD